MISILIILAAGAFCWGGFIIACELSEVPSFKASEVMLRMGHGSNGKAENPLRVFVVRVARLIVPFLRIDSLRKERLQAALEISGSEQSPEEYLAWSLASAGLTVLCGIPFCIASPLLAPIVLILGVGVYLAQYYRVFDTVKKRRKAIEAEVPRFTLLLSQSLKTDRDVLRILSSYRKVAGPEFSRELDTTIADMKTGNYENALQRLSTRVGSALLTETVRGLIGTLRGDDQSIYFEMLSHDMRKIEQNRLEKEAEKQPAKIQKYSMLMLVCIILIYAVVLLTEVLGSLGTLF